MRFFFSLVCAFLTATVMAASQAAPPPGTAVELTVILLLANGQPVPAGTRAELKHDGRTKTAEGKSNALGEVAFPAVPPGTYRCRISGKGIYSITSAAFSLTPGSRPRTEVFRVQPYWTAVRPGRQVRPTVSAASLRVPDKARNELRKGVAFLNRGDLARAKIQFERALAAYPPYASAYNNLGIIEMQKGNEEGGKRNFEKAMELDPNNVSACLNLSRMRLREQKYDEVVRMMGRCSKLDPNNPEALTILATAQLEIGELDQAIFTAERVHRGPHFLNAGVHFVAARAYEAKDQPQKALSELRLYLAELPKGTDTSKAQQVLERLEKSVYGK